VWRGGFWAARPETRFARKAGAVRVASETPELDEKQACPRWLFALATREAGRSRAAARMHQRARPIGACNRLAPWAGQVAGRWS
jgi:hypothetical protein